MKELLEHFGRSNRTKLREQVLLPLLASGLIAMTIPEKPTSSKQRYRITESGRKTLEAAALKPE
jgi:DNA-binding PadR family transcriptional regulator